MENFAQWLESVETAETLFPQELRTFLWKKNRGWKKLLTQEPAPTVIHYIQLLKAMPKTGNLSIDARVQMMGYYFMQLLLALVVRELFPEEWASSMMGKVDFVKIVRESLKPVSTPEEANAVAETLYDGNHPIRGALHQFSIFMKVYLGVE